VFGSVSGEPDPTFPLRACEAFATTLRDAGIVSAYVRLHPLLPTPLSALKIVGEVVEQGDSLSIDLSITPDEMWAQTRHAHRRSINRARRAGYQVRIDQEWTRFDEFIDAYGQSMERLGATEFWRLPRAYFHELRRALDGHIHLCVAEVGGAFTAAAVLTECDGIAEYHMSGTMDDHVKASPTKLIIDFARRWAKDRGNRVLDLTGSTRKGDSLIHFKLGFTPLLQTMYSWRVVADREEYDALVRCSPARFISGAGPTDTGFFPVYRRPAPIDLDL
jgi:lipid II:glycine glycyltransferase (peptidoglycan interpeptide bridge formation enzyme)